MGQASEEFIEWLAPDDGLILHYTSGSTGQPKGCIARPTSNAITLYLRKIRIRFKRR